ncbi:MAG: hypothetical protein IJI66_14015 [Erysipelotrichaceae bacterium]|nr:hypothetical protein [Erysipelotrichaceae bacterium]
MITEIKTEDIIENEIYDRVFCKLTLDDYDWMRYTFDISFPLKEGLLKCLIEYLGSQTCMMTVNCYKDSILAENCTYRFDCGLFKEYIVRYLKAHIESWNSSYAFSAEKIAIEFYNAICKEGEIET